MSDRRDRRRHEATRTRVVVARDGERERRKNRLTTVAAVIAFVAIVGGAAIYVATQSNSSAPVAQATPVVGAPAGKVGSAPTGRAAIALSANARQANEIIDTPIQTRLAALRGVPIVVNQWASWCTNCRFEFPFFQAESRRYLHQVAFVGLDSQDGRGDAAKFLTTFPVAYPSIFDQSAQQAASLGGGQGWPTTMFFDRAGKETFVHEGAYPSATALDQDIRLYALGS